MGGWASTASEFRTNRIVTQIVAKNQEKEAARTTIDVTRETT